MSASNPPDQLLLVGIGNDGRGDDALGWLFVERFAEYPGIDPVYRYQLQIEDADLIRQYDRVVFVDASLQQIDAGFSFRQCAPLASLHFSTHKIDPATIVWLAKEIYQATPRAYILAIQGYYWELHQGLSAAAAQHFDRASSFFEKDLLPAWMDDWDHAFVSLQTR